jgi:hypothetical protein
MNEKALLKINHENSKNKYEHYNRVLKILKKLPNTVVFGNFKSSLFD